MALAAAVVAVGVLDLWHCGSDAAEVVGGELMVCRASAAPSRAKGELEALSPPADPGVGLSGTSMPDGGGGAVQSFKVEVLASLCEVVSEATHFVFCLVGEMVATCLEGKERGSESETSEVLPLDGFWSFVPLSATALSLTGPRTLLVTVASWDITRSTPLSAGATGELELKLELEVAEDKALRLAAAAHSLRLSASFFSLGMPGEEQEVRGVSWLSVVRESVVFVVVLQSGVSILAVEGVLVVGLSRLCSSALDANDAVFPLILFESCGGVGLRKLSLLTEMNALPGVEKGRGPQVGFVVPVSSRTFLSCRTTSSVDKVGSLSFTPAEEVF